MRRQRLHAWTAVFAMAGCQACAIGAWVIGEGFVAWMFLLYSFGALMYKTFLDNTPSQED